MYSEFDETSLVGMSNSDLFLAEKDPKLMKFEFLLRPTIEFSDEYCQTPAPLEDRPDDDHDQVVLLRQDEDKDDDDEEIIRGKKDEEIKLCEQTDHVASSSKRKLEMSSSSVLEELINKDVVVEEDDDGFRTPTSLDKKIPLIPAQCPPAPRKPKSRPSTKRKSNHHHHRHHRYFQILHHRHDISEEIESLFPPAVLLADHHLGLKIKKARR